MTQANILLADNEADFLDTRREYLERAGFTVITASSPAEIKEKIKNEKVDLAVLDIRLVNDDDEKDISGLEVAKTVSQFLPVVILTGYGAFNYARQALSPQADGASVAQAFVTKEEGPEALITAVKRVLAITESQKEIDFEETDKKPLAKQRPLFSLVALLLALGAGIIATIYGDPRWLIGTVALAILAVLLIGLSE